MEWGGDGEDKIVLQKKYYNESLSANCKKRYRASLYHGICHKADKRAPPTTQRRSFEKREELFDFFGIVFVGALGAVRTAVTFVTACAFALLFADNSSYHHAQHHCRASNNNYYFANAQAGCNTCQHLFAPLITLLSWEI